MLASRCFALRRFQRKNSQYQSTRKLKTNVALPLSVHHIGLLPDGCDAPHPKSRCQGQPLATLASRSRFATAYKKAAPGSGLANPLAGSQGESTTLLLRRIWLRGLLRNYVGHQANVHPTILGATLGRLVIGDRLILAQPDHVNLVCRHIVLGRQVLDHGLPTRRCSPLCSGSRLRADPVLPWPSSTNPPC